MKMVSESSAQIAPVESASEDEAIAVWIGSAASAPLELFLYLLAHYSKNEAATKASIETAARHCYRELFDLYVSSNSPIKYDRWGWKDYLRDSRFWYSSPDADLARYGLTDSRFRKYFSEDIFVSAGKRFLESFGHSQWRFILVDYAQPNINLAKEFIHGQLGFRDIDIIHAIWASNFGRDYLVKKERPEYQAKDAIRLERLLDELRSSGKRIALIGGSHCYRTILSNGSFRSDDLLDDCERAPVRLMARHELTGLGHLLNYLEASGDPYSIKHVIRASYQLTSLLELCDDRTAILFQEGNSAISDIMLCFHHIERGDRPWDEKWRASREGIPEMQNLLRNLDWEWV